MVNVSNMSNDGIMQLKHNRLCSWQATCGHWVTSNISQMCPLALVGPQCTYMHTYVHTYIHHHMQTHTKAGPAKCLSALSLSLLTSCDTSGEVATEEEGTETEMCVACWLCRP